MKIEFEAVDPADSLNFEIQPKNIDYSTPTEAFKRESLLRFYGATNIVDVMAGKDVRQYNLYMFVNPRTISYERPFIELKVLQNGFFVEPTPEALTAFLKRDWSNTGIVIDDLYSVNNVPVGCYFHTCGPEEQRVIKNLLIVIEWMPLNPPLAFGDVPIKKVPPVLSGWISMGFEKLRSAYPELDPPLEPVTTDQYDIAHRVKLRRSSKSSESDSASTPREPVSNEVQSAAPSPDFHDFFIGGFEFDTVLKSDAEVPIELGTGAADTVYNALQDAYFVSINTGSGLL
jgi:hypothetical protein